MTLSAKLLNELQAVIGQQHPSARAAEGQRTAACHADECNALAVTIFDLVLETPELAAATAFELQAASADLAKRVNYLLEPIAPIETDAQGCTVQLRSN